MLKSKRMRAIALALATGALATAGTAQMQPITQGSVLEAVAELRPGQFLWAPQIAPEGPVLVVVNIATQRLVAYRNGVPIGVSTVSTGRPGHRTPTGIFTILQKRVRHFSSTYNNAPMPYMQRLTWRGIALHGGPLPGYPASHGCIRLPHEFAALLYDQTALGMTVVIVNREGRVEFAPTPESLAASQPPSAPDGIVWEPWRAPAGPVSIVVSGADRRMIVLRNGIEIGSAPVAFDGTIDRMQAYLLESIVGGTYNWRPMALPAEQSAPALPPLREGRRFDGPDRFREALTQVALPGTALIVIPDSLGRGAGAASAVTVIDDAPPVIGS